MRLTLDRPITHQIAQQAASLRTHWFWRVVLIPFAIVRLALLLVAYLSQNFLVNPGYGNLGVTGRGWETNPLWFLDIWARWDSHWYISIMEYGYQVQGKIDAVPSNLAFYPMYPYIVKILTWPFFGRFGTEGVLLVGGILVSNAFLLGALFLFYKLMMFEHGDESLAERGILYLLVFPTAFYFSSVFTESTFLFFAIASFYAARKGRWLLCGIMAACLSLSRPLGVSAVASLGVIYLESVGWNLRKIRADILWLGLAPLALLGYMASLYPLTKDFLAIFHAQGAWHRSFTWPWETFIHGFWYYPYVSPIDQAFIALFLVLCVIALFKLPSLSYGLYGLVFLVPVLFTGTVQSTTRFCSILFPGFMLLAMAGKNKHLDRLILVLFFAIQVIWMASWTRFYWVQ